MVCTCTCNVFAGVATLRASFYEFTISSSCADRRLTMKRRQEAQQEGTKNDVSNTLHFRSGSTILIASIRRRHSSTASLTRKMRKVFAKLKCKVCTKFVDSIRGRKHFSEKWIAGADSLRIRNVRNYAQNNQHAHAMSLLKKQRSQSAGLGRSCT